METTTTPVEQKQGEPAVTTAAVKSQFDILETEPVFASDDKPVKQTTEQTNTTKTAEEIANEKAIADTKSAEDATVLATKAKELGLTETATKEEIALAETKIADDLKAKATELGLPVTATTEEITAAELAKTEQEGFITNDELQTGVLGAKDGTWQALMLAKGLEVPSDYKEENGFDIYEKAETAKWQAEIEKAKVEAQESVFTKLKPDVAVALELANSMPDMTIEQILNPTIHLDNLLKLDKEELIKVDIKLDHPEYTPEMVDIKFQEIKDANQIDIKDNMIRLDISKEKAQTQNFHKQKIQEYQERQIQEKTTAEKGKIEQVIKALDRVPTFLDKKIIQTDRQYLANKITSGAINELVNNPEKLARAIVYLEFHDKGVQSYENRVREKLLVEQKKTLHNTPVITTGAANTVVTTPPIKNQFDILKTDFGEK